MASYVKRGYERVVPEGLFTCAAVRWTTRSGATHAVQKVRCNSRGIKVKLWALPCSHSHGLPGRESHLRRVRLLRIHGPRVAVLAVRMCRHCRVHALVARHRRPDVKIYVKVAPLVRVQVGVFICASRASLLRNCGDKCPLGADVFRTVDRALATNGENGTIWVDPRARIVAVAEMVGNQRLPRTIERLRCMYRGAA